MNADVRLALGAVGCLFATAALGALVVRRVLAPWDAASILLRGRGVRLAVFFTRSGYWPALVLAGTLLFAIELFVRGSVGFAVVLTATQLFSQALSDAAKAVYRRVRPENWLYRREIGFSFPSGHATTAVVFYGSLMIFGWSLPLPAGLHVAVTLLPALFVVGIPWSRMALAAHYGTDVLGGVLLGGACLCMMLLVLRHLPATGIFG